MNPELWRQVENIFSEAVKVTDEERVQFLDRACGDQNQLRLEVEAMLSVADETGHFLENPALSLASGPEEILSVGDCVGPYRIDQWLGSGGMGTVYLAVRDDQEFEQRVALKVLKAGHGGTEAVARFRQERQILAGLEHPNIAALKDGGTAADVPFFVMEYVEGEPIDRHCQRHSLDPRARIELVCKVAGAVHFFHQHLVLHRDLKPGNILIKKENGEPKLLDFGIAKLQRSNPSAANDGSSYAKMPTGPTPMTLAYASPEQMRGEAISTASDVYSLGVLLYELLTGRQPYPPTRSRAERVEQIEQGLLEPPGISRDLDSIVNKALAPNPGERYISAEQFADDLRRYLSGFPVQARGSTAVYRLQRFVGRHRAGVAAVAATVLVLVGFSINMGILKERAEIQQNKAERVSDFLVGMIESADPLESRGKDLTVRELLDEGTEQIQNELQNEPEVRAELLGAMGRSYLGLTLFEPALELLQESLKVRQLAGAEPRDLAISHINLARFYQEQGQLVRASEHSNKAIDVLKRKRLPVSKDAEVLTEALSRRARLLKASGKLEDAEKVYREVLRKKVERYGRKHEKVAATLNDLATCLRPQGKLDEANLHCQEALRQRVRFHGPESTEVAVTLNSCGSISRDQGDLDAAESMFRQSLKIRKERLGSHHPKIANTLNNLAVIVQRLGRLDEAKVLYNEVGEIYQRHYDPDHWLNGWLLRNRAGLCLARGEPALAEGLVRRAIKILRMTKPADHWRVQDAESVLEKCLTAQTPKSPGVVVEEVGHGSTLEQAGLAAGDLLRAWKRLPSPPHNPAFAIDRLNSPFDWWKLQFEQAPRGTVELTGERQGVKTKWTVQPGVWKAKTRPAWSGDPLKLYQQGLHLIEADNQEAGIRAWQELLVQLRAPSTPNPSTPSQCLWLEYKIARIWAKAQQWEKIHNLFEENGQENSLRFAQAHVFNELGNIAWNLRDLPHAETYYTQALKIRQIDQCPSCLDVARILINVGITRDGQGRLLLAEEHLERARSIQTAQAPNSVDLAMTLNNLGVISRKKGDLKIAMENFARALEVQTTYEPESRTVAAMLSNLGILATQRGDVSLALEYYKQALNMQEMNDPNGLDVARNLSNLGIISDQSGEWSRANAHYSRALEIQQALSPGSLDEARTLNNLGVIATHRGQLNLATQYLSRALEIKEIRSPESLDIASTLKNLGVAMRKSGDLARATEFQNRALAIRRAIAPETSAVEFFELARLARISGDLPTAARFFDRSLKLVQARIDQLGVSPSLLSRLRARDEYPLFQEAIRLEIERNRPEAAFQLLERSRAQSFLALLAERDLVFADLPAELDQERRRVARRYDRLLKAMQNLHPVEDSERIEEIQGRQVLLRQRQQEIHQEIRQRFPRLAAIQYPRPLDFSQTRRSLDAGTVLLAYVVGDEESFLFIVRPERELEVRTLKFGPADLRGQIRRFRQLIREAVPSSPMEDVSRATLDQLGARLYQRLLAPAEEAIAASQRVLLVLDGPLHSLPWSALRRPDGRHVAEWKPIHSALSGTVWAEIKASRKRISADGSASRKPYLVAFGDPVHPAANPDELITRAGLHHGLFNWRRLPFTQVEVEELVQLLGRQQARAYLGSDATEDRVRALAKEPDIVHFAVHAHVDDRFPWNSALVLTQPEEVSTNRENGLLQVWEIMESVRLDADLIVLSACETAKGEELGGEGLISLTRAFQFAGGRSVAASLWSVSDQTTPAFMVRFYRHLLGGKPKDEALRAAQVELMRGPIEVMDENGRNMKIDASGPYYWAAFQLYGDWR